MESLSQFVHDPTDITQFCGIYIVSYYIVSIFSIAAAKTGKKEPTRKCWWRKNGPLDIITSITWVAFAILLIWSLATLAFSATLTLSYLIAYYFFFIFLFAFLYGILAWHSPDMLEDVSADDWTALAEHVIISTQTQTTLGYTKGKPGRLLAQAIACVQALLGIFFLTLAIQRAVQ